MNKTENGYNIWAPDYDDFDNPMIFLEQKAFENLNFKFENASVLDLGCGTGRNALKILKYNVESYTGVDFSQGMLGKAIAKTKEYKDKSAFIKHDLSIKLPFEDNSFDIVILTLVLEHIKDLNFLYSEVKRVSKVNAIMYIAEMHPFMFLKNAQAHFTDPGTGEQYTLGSVKRVMSDYINPAINNGLKLKNIQEYIVDRESMEILPKLKKHEGLPVLFTMELINMKEIN